MAWKSLHTDILDKISKETNILVNSGNLDKIYQKYLLTHSELYINDKPIRLTFLTGTINSFQWNGEMASYNPESFIEMEFEADFSSEITNSTAIRLEFKKNYFRDITSLIHAYVYTDIQKNWELWSYIIGQDDRSYFPSTFAWKTYGFRNTLDESSTKNTFILYIEPRILDQKNTAAQSISTEKNSQNTSWFKVWETLQVFFYEQSSFSFKILGLLVAIFAWMMHGLLPGHSKVLIGTYMMGHSQIRYKEILTLIVSVTFSHTIFIFILAIIVLSLQKWLSTVTAYVLTLSAIWYILFWIYFYITWTRSLQRINNHSSESIFEHQTIHDWDCHCESTSKKSTVRWTTFTGMLAGCNPCIDALALFIFAITIGNGTYAFLMIIFFSLGLWLMLGILALCIKKSKILLQKKSQKFAQRITAHITILSWIAIIIMGSYTLLI
jgi:ABC-type nickel/cobalt efflux system permease component RcnA